MGALSLHLDHEAYGFGEIGDSSLSITLNGVCSTDPCDAVLAVSFGDDSFLPLAVGRDFDNLMPKEIAIKNGDASQFLPASFFLRVNFGVNSIPFFAFFFVSAC